MTTETNYGRKIKKFMHEKQKKSCFRRNMNKKNFYDSRSDFAFLKCWRLCWWQKTQTKIRFHPDKKHRREKKPAKRNRERKKISDQKRVEKEITKER